MTQDLDVLFGQAFLPAVAGADGGGLGKESEAVLVAG